MMENYNEIEIQATPEEVWEVLTDMEKHAEWNPLIYRAEGEIAVGQNVKVSARSAWGDMNFRCKVVSVETNRAFQWNWYVVFPFLMRGEHSYTIVPVNQRSVRFMDREIFKGIVVPLLARNLATDSKDRLVGMDKALKKRVEQRVRTA